MASSHIRGVHSCHKLHLRNYTPQFHNTECVALIAFCVIGLPFFGCLSLTGRDNERLVLTICTEHTNQNQSLHCSDYTDTNMLPFNIVKQQEKNGWGLLMTACWWIMGLKCSAPWVHYTVHHLLLLKLHYSSIVDMKELMNAVRALKAILLEDTNTHTSLHMYFQ